METAKLSKTVRLSNEDIGRLQRRLNEIVRRVEAGAIDLSWVDTEQQRILEGRKIPEVRYRNRAEPLTFVRPPAKERRTSKAPLSMRLPNWVNRLRWPDRNREHVMAEMWEAECIPRQCLNYGRTPIHAIMDGEKITDRDVQVISSTLQWLGTNVGGEFLRRFVRTTEMYLN